MEKYVYEDMFRIEESHWWFVARREIVLSQIEQFLHNKKENRISDVGCGTGAFLGYLERFGEVYGLDSSSLAIEYCQQRGKGLVQKGVLPYDIPFEKESFDVITALDVLEHIDDDIAALKTIYRLLRKGGTFVCTVPAFSFLWSGHDKAHYHFRRYTRCKLKEKLIATGFKINKVSYYNTLLFPLIALIRLIRRLNPRTIYTSDARMPSGIINVFLKQLFASEKYLLRHMNLPFGVSLIAICEKR